MTHPVRFRLLLAIPLVLLCLSIATGWGVLSYDELAGQASHLSPTHRSHARWLIIGAGLGSALIGLLMAIAITKPLRRITALADKLAPLKEPQRGWDEIDSLALAFSRMMLSLDRFISDSYILHSLPIGVLLVNREGRLLYTNQVACDMLGIPKDGEQLSSETERYALAEVLPDRASNYPVRLLLQETFSGTRTEPEEVTATCRTGPGADIHVLMTVTRFAGGIRHDPFWDQPVVQLSFRSLTAQRQVRDEIRRVDQLATIGCLTSGLVHELKNPLASIQGLTELLRADLSSNHPNREYCETILRATRRMDRLIAELLATVRSEQEVCAPVDIREMIQEALSSIAQDIAGKRVRITEDYAQGLPVINAQPGKLRSAFTNILLNAVEASSEDQSVAITAEAQSDHAPGVLVRINNGGSYIPPDQRARIFLPFTTNKQGGTGLGLFLAQQFVQSQGGQITMDSSPEHGTTFEIRLVPSA